MTVRKAEITTAATELPLTLAELKNHGRIESDHENNLIERYLKAATVKVFGDTQRSLTIQTYGIKLDRLGRVVPLEYPPTVAGSAKVFYYDDQGAEQEVDAALYYLDTNSLPGRLVLRSDQQWPETSRDQEGYRVEWQGGYVTAKLPEDLRDAVAVQALYRYRHRGDAAATELPPDGYRGLIRNYIVSYEYGY